MKVKFSKINPEAEEYAELHIHEMNGAMNRLAGYLEQELFRSVILICQQEENICRVPCSEIYLIETVKDRQMVHTGREVYEVKKRLYELEKLLPHNFVRISKSVIMNIERAESYTPMLNGLMKVSMGNSLVAYISRKYLKEVKNRILEVEENE